MDNVYCQSESERNSIVELPDGYGEGLGNELTRLLSSFWRELVRDRRMVRGLQQARGYVLAQRYLDLLEVLRLQDRFDAPVFHRELWYPIAVRRSQRNTSQENLLSVGSNGIVLGAQPDGSIYGEGTVLRLGKMGNFEKYVTYPVCGGEAIRRIASTIVDNVLNPKVRMEADRDFVFRNGTVIFPVENDPLAEGSPFDPYEVPSDDPGDMDAEAILWASDVYIDRGYVADHVSYPIGVSAPSTAESKRIINAAWDALTDGMTPCNENAVIASMVNIPVVQGEAEKVMDIRFSGDGGHVAVVTDARTYKVSGKAVLRKCVKVGAVLRRGQLLDESVRIYPMLTNPDPGHVNRLTGFRVPLRQDIPTVTVPPELIRAGTKYGIYATWDEVEVKSDMAGRPYFDIGGDADDVESFWNGVWDEADRRGTDLEKVFGPVGSRISPADFFLRNLVGANTIVVSIDMGQIDDASWLKDPMFFGLLAESVPSAARMVFFEHRPVSGEDMAELGDAFDAVSLSARAGIPADIVDCGGDACDRVSVRFVRPSPDRKTGAADREDVG